MANEIEERLLPSKNEEGGDLKQRVCDESKKIWKVALPGMVARVASFGTIIVTQSFIGHISALELSGFALVESLSVRFVNGVLTGMSSATETLCGQAYGAGQYHMMGIYLQRSWIIDFLTVTILMPVFIFGGQIFRLLRQEEDIAKSAGYISLWVIPFIYNYVFNLTNQTYLQAQQKNMIVAVLSIVRFIIHVIMSWLFVIKLGLGVAGAIMALWVSSWFLVLGQFTYIFGGWCPQTWQGFTLAAFKDLWPVVKLSVASGVMVCLELWYNAVLVLLAGYMRNAEVAISAFSICLNINAWIFMISLGFLAAACVRVANELGRGDANAVKFSIKVLSGTSIIIGVFFWILISIFGGKIGYLFTNVKEVAETVSSLSILLGISVLFNAIYPILSGVAVGAGLQKTAAIINLVCYYLIGIPIGALLGYLAHFEVTGIWIGMICGVFTQTLALGFMTWKTNWDKEVDKASERLQRLYLEAAEAKRTSGQA